MGNERISEEKNQQFGRNNENEILIRRNNELHQEDIANLKEKYTTQIEKLKEKQFKKHFQNMDKIRVLEQQLETCYSYEQLQKLPLRATIDIRKRINDVINFNQNNQYN